MNDARGRQIRAGGRRLDWSSCLISHAGTLYASDHQPFDWIGIPGFQFIQYPIDYTPQLHHTNEDLYHHCVPEDPVQFAVVMASFVYRTAMREPMLPRKPLPVPVELR